MPAAITVLKQRCIQLVCIHYSTPVNHLYYCIHVCILMIWYLSQIGVMWKHRRLQVHPRSGVRYIENNKMWPKEPIRHWNRHYAKTFMVPYSILTLMYKQWVPGIQKNWHVTTFLLIAVRNADVLLLPLARKNAVHRATTLVYILQLEKKKEKEAVVFLIFTVACPCITFNYIRHTLHNRPPAAVDPTTPRNTNTRHVLCNTSGRKSNNIDRDRLFIPRDLFARPKIFSSTLFREDIQRCEHPRSQR